MIYSYAMIIHQITRTGIVSLGDIKVRNLHYVPVHSGQKESVKTQEEALTFVIIPNESKADLVGSTSGPGVLCLMRQ